MQCAGRRPQGAAAGAARSAGTRPLAARMQRGSERERKEREAASPIIPPTGAEPRSQGAGVGWSTRVPHPLPMLLSSCRPLSAPDTRSESACRSQRAAAFAESRTPGKFVGVSVARLSAVGAAARSAPGLAAARNQPCGGRGGGGGGQARARTGVSCGFGRRGWASRRWLQYCHYWLAAHGPILGLYHRSRSMMLAGHLSDLLNNASASR